MLPRRKPNRSGIRDNDGPIRSPAHLAHVRGFVCVAFKSGECEGRIEAAHYRSAANAGTGVKPGDEWVFPACAKHHQEQHRIGQPAFEAKYGVDLAKECEALARSSAHIRRAKQERGR
ncbi:hypothetical protein L2U69_12010 [Zavarzinia compransoris]|uniref:hypothetical protein n=1 Tax=Zavarzinia marina TaxID=2911065 RepID=UPI001F35EDBE|nr:hypothetical protein [Zavarzinia marina]MCF4166371.1 hypothetical protein [Zavarzinia marina]